MNNHPINDALTAIEDTIEIDLYNKNTGTTYLQAAVFGTNTLGQVLKEYAVDIGVNPNDSKILFENKRTGASTSDTNETIEGLGLREGDVLTIIDNASVAADVSEDDCLGSSFFIDLYNEVTKTWCVGVEVYGENTFDQVLREYALDINVNPNNRKHSFKNKRTGANTCEANKTLIELGFQDGDLLMISDCCFGVA